MLNSFKEWLSCHSVYKSLLSGRLFSLFYDESPEENFGSNGTINMVRDTAISSQSTLTENQVSLSPAQAQPLMSEAVADIRHINSKGKNDPSNLLEAFKINFLRLVHRIEQSSSNPIVHQVLYRLELASLIRAVESNLKKPALQIDKARSIAVAMEASGQDDLDFSLKILVLGKTGTGKSSTINSLFGQKMVSTNAFRPSTEAIQQVVGTIKGIKVAVIDTPGLFSSNTNQRRNRMNLIKVRRFIRKSPPDVVLYFERFDLINRSNYDFPLLKLISNVLGSSLWFNTILVMTHSSSPLPEGVDGFPVSYEEFAGHCVKLLQSYIRLAVSNTQLENPVLFVENHPICINGDKILPNGRSWRSQFLLLSIATKILNDANSLLKFQDSFPLMKSDNMNRPSLPHLLLSFLQPRPSQPSNDAEVYDVSDSEEEDDEYDCLPPIRILTKSQFQILSRSHKNAYLDELDYRESLYLKKQWRAEVRRRKKGMLRDGEQMLESNENDNISSQEIVQLPDMAIPSSFDSDCPSHRYRCLLETNEWLLRPVLDPNSWDHDTCFDGISLDFSKEIKRNLTASVAGQMRKGKEDFTIQSESGFSFVHENLRLLSGFDIQTSGKDFVCTFHGDAMFTNLTRNSTGCGLSLTSSGETYFAGAKLEDSVSIGKRFKLIASGGGIAGGDQAAYGGRLEAVIRGKDFPVRDNEKAAIAGTILSSGKEVILGGNLQTEFRFGRSAKVALDVNLNSRRLGHITLKISTSEHSVLGLVAAVSLIQSLLNRRVNSKK